MHVLGDIPKKGALLYPEKTALCFEGTSITYRELNTRVNRFANALMGLGCTGNDRVAILSENTNKYMEIYFAAAKAAMSVTPLNFRLSNSELIHIVNDSEATVFIMGEGYEQQSKVLKPELPGIQKWISLDTRFDDYLDYEDLLAEASGEEPGIHVGENDLMILMYTGGTTGLPKGVMLSHCNLLTAMHGMIMAYSFARSNVECFNLPLFHISLWPVLCTLMTGGRVVIVRRPDIKGILTAIQEEKCTRIVLVPTLLAWMLDFPDFNTFDLSSLREITYAGSPMPPEVVKRCIQQFGNILTQGYGLTEAAPLGTVLFSEDHAFEGPKAGLLQSIGKEGTMVEIQVFDDQDNPLEPGAVGEIVIKGKNIMMGYWKNPELTAETLKGGWLHTGDVGMIDKQGYIFLKDRKADMIVTGGENVYPKETEEILYEHPAVQECAVVSAPDTKWGERVQAVVVLREHCSVGEKELIDYCKARLAGYKCPKKIEFWETLPKTTVGKILRREIKQSFWKGQGKMIG
ncbi:MAG: long-chain-fatty-acid--CoA ligase [Pseudomonadota bacterium]